MGIVTKILGSSYASPPLPLARARSHHTHAPYLFVRCSSFFPLSLAPSFVYLYLGRGTTLPKPCWSYVGRPNPTDSIIRDLQRIHVCTEPLVNRYRYSSSSLMQLLHATCNHYPPSRRRGCKAVRRLRAVWLPEVTWAGDSGKPLAGVRPWVARTVGGACMCK
jgi:hypothetical protein